MTKKIFFFCSGKKKIKKKKIQLCFVDFSAKHMHGQSSEPTFPEERHGAFESNDRLFTSEQVPHVGQREHLKKDQSQIWKLVTFLFIRLKKKKNMKEILNLTLDSRV